MFLAGFVAGCAPARPFTPEFYSPQKPTKLLEPLPPIAVYSLVDERGTREPTLIVESASISGHNRRDHATEPVSGGLTRAFAQGFRDRGFPVVDMTARYYSPGGQGSEARVAISGRVLEFGARIVRSGVFTYDQRVACSIVLNAYEIASGRRFWTKSYSQVWEGGLLPADPMTLLSRALAQAVEQAVTDPELVGAVTLATSIQAQASEKIIVDGSTGVMPLLAALAKAYQERYPAATVEMGKGLGTRARLEALAAGKIDIALASHGLVAEELTRQGMAVHEIAKVAVVFGVNASVPTANITDRQVCDVYAGTLTNWKELGGADLAIAPRTRPDSEVDAEVVRGKIPCLKDLKMPEVVKVMPRSGDMAKELESVVGAIGMTTATVVEQSRGKVKLLSLNDVIPSAGNVERKIYTLTRDSLLVTKTPTPPAVARFLDFIRSPAGAAAIVANGAVPVK